jgi:hypothetical protein
MPRQTLGRFTQQCQHSTSGKPPSMCTCVSTASFRPQPSIHGHCLLQLPLAAVRLPPAWFNLTRPSPLLPPGCLQHLLRLARPDAPAGSRRGAAQGDGGGGSCGGAQRADRGGGAGPHRQGWWAGWAGGPQWLCAEAGCCCCNASCSIAWHQLDCMRASTVQCAALCCLPCVASSLPLPCLVPPWLVQTYKLRQVQSTYIKPNSGRLMLVLHVSRLL